MDELNQVCVNSGPLITTIVSYLIYLGGLNAVPSPDKVSNPVLKFLSRALHFVAVDVTTALKK